MRGYRERRRRPGHPVGWELEREDLIDGAGVRRPAATSRYAEPLIADERRAATELPATSAASSGGRRVDGSVAARSARRTSRRTIVTVVPFGGVCPPPGSARKTMPVRLGGVVGLHDLDLEPGRLDQPGSRPPRSCPTTFGDLLGAVGVEQRDRRSPRRPGAGRRVAARRPGPWPRRTRARSSDHLKPSFAQLGRGLVLRVCPRRRAPPSRVCRRRRRGRPRCPGSTKSSALGVLAR